MVDKNDKTKSKNWVDGDTFAWKIEGKEFPEFQGRYLILIHTLDTHWDMPKNKKTFRVKITEEKCLPKTEEDLDKLEYIKNMGDIYSHIYYLNPNLVKSLKEDEYGLIYQYIFKLILKRNDNLSNFIFIGNYNLRKPINEYIPENPFDGVNSAVLKYFVENQLNSYKFYNLKNGIYYENEMQKKIKDEFPEWVKEQEFIKKLGEELDGPNGKEILKKMGIDIENEVPYENETYVGKDNFKE